MTIQSYRDKPSRDIAKGEDSKEARKGFGLHSLKADRQGQLAIRINDQYRICFLWGEKGPELVEITDSH